MPSTSFVPSPDGGEEGDTTGSIVPEPVADVGAPTLASSSSLSSPLPPPPLVPNTDAEQLSESKQPSTGVENEVRDHVVFSLCFFHSFSNV